MQKSIVILALFGIIKAIHIKQGFIPGMDDDDLDGLVLRLAEGDKSNSYEAADKVYRGDMVHQPSPPANQTLSAQSPAPPANQTLSAQPSPAQPANQTLSAQP